MREKAKPSRDISKFLNLLGRITFVMTKQYLRKEKITPT